MATINEVKAELERRGGSACDRFMEPMPKFDEYIFSFRVPNGSYRRVELDVFELEEMSAAQAVDRIWPESRKPPRFLPSRRLPKPQKVCEELYARGAEAAWCEYRDGGSVLVGWVDGGSKYECTVTPPTDTDRVTPQQIVDMAWPESALKNTPGFRDTTRKDTVGRELTRWLSETLSGTNISVTVSANGRVRASWMNKSGAVLGYDSGRDKVTARDAVDDILCGRVEVVDRNAGTVSISSKHPGHDADTIECGGWDQPDVERETHVGTQRWLERVIKECIPGIDYSLRTEGLDQLLIRVASNESDAQRIRERINSELPAYLAWQVVAMCPDRDTTCADCGSIMGTTCPCASDSLPAAGAVEADEGPLSVTPSNLRDNIAQRLGPKVCETIYKHRQPEPITVTSAEQYRMLYGKEPPPGMFEAPVLQQGLRPPEYIPVSPHNYREAQRLLSQKPLPPLNFAHPEPETAEQWASHNSDPVEDMQRWLDRHKQRNAPSTPSGITDLIRSGIAPHEYPHRTGKIELGRHGDCRCILCTLPRGKSWGEVELQRRIEWMGQQVHESLHAVGAWIHRGKTTADEVCAV